MQPGAAGASKSEGIGENIGEEGFNVESMPSPRPDDNGEGSGGGTAPDTVDEARAAGYKCWTSSESSAVRVQERSLPFKRAIYMHKSDVMRLGPN